jgi:type I restriction enzyme S subunit
VKASERRLKYCVWRPIKNGIGAAAEYDERSWPRYVRITDISGPRSLRDDTFASLPPEQAAEAPFDIGDILGAAVGATYGKTYLHTEDIGPACYAGYLVRISPVEQFDSRFVAYWTECQHYWDQVNSAVIQSTIQNFSATKYGELRIPAPLLSQQRAIADYLDRETGRIDALIAAKERVLELLAEKRRALITRAVTRGLDPHAPLRDSGIPWLGEIPAHWETKRARWLFRERDIRSETGSEELLTVSHLTGVTPRSEKDVNMFEAETTEGYKLCETGDLVINTLWAWMGAMGVTRMNGIVSPAYNVYQAGPRLLPAYIDVLVRLPVFAQEVTRYSKGVWSSRLRLYPEGFFEVYLPVPPLNEQCAVVEYLDRETSKLDRVREATERTIVLLKERRSALIAAAVTGQIDVEAQA